MHHVFKLYNTKSENRVTITIEASKDSKIHAINEAIRLHSKVLRGSNKPSNWIVEKQTTTTEEIKNPTSKQPKAKSKQFKRLFGISSVFNNFMI